MGNSTSFNRRIEQQEEYVRRRMNEPDMSDLKHRFFKEGYPKYNDHQIKGYLRQEYYRQRKPNSYVLDRDIDAANSLKPAHGC